jgi:hypothetical protein
MDSISGEKLGLEVGEMPFFGAVGGDVPGRWEEGESDCVSLPVGDMVREVHCSKAVL